ncbi:MAG TPA: M14 metallopeptidase family protein [Pyrinomonadaceae bacterium]|nr:M14 metallopeptidase family protein [Pyrinomonadaceae bacterium]
MRLRIFAFILILAVAVSTDFLYLASAQPDGQRTQNSRRTEQIPAPADTFGFTPGDDRKLASWNQILEYFDRLDRASDRVKFEALGKTTMDKPFAMAIISAPENLARLDEYKRIQDQLADPRKLGANSERKAAQLITSGKTIVLITCGIHSTEVASTLSSTLIAHRLASSNEPEIQNILKNTIILLVPSLNPDGVDIVKNWYDKTLGTPYEGTDPPELYHKYVGHDNNRDWYAFTQVETKITVDKIHNVWHPQIVHDIHQQGAFGSRLFLPPYMPPVEPNVPKQIIEGYTQLGNWMASELRARGFQGITTNSTYDAWTPARAYSHYHAGVRMLSETASARLATPITVKFDELRAREGYNPQKESDKFGPVWRGGEWHLRDITNYMTTAAFTLLRHAADNREQWLRRFYEIGKEAVRPRKNGELFGFIGADLCLRETLLQGGVEFEYLDNYVLDGKKQVSKRWVNQGRVMTSEMLIRMDQPYGSFAKALLERQHYPNLRDSSGNPIAPYDVTAHTLPLLYGEEVIPVSTPFEYRQLAIAQPDIPCPRMSGVMVNTTGQKPPFAIYKSHMPSMDEGWTRWWFNSAKMKNHLLFSSLEDKEVRKGHLRSTYKTIVFPDQAPRAILNGHRNGSMPSEYTGGLGQEGVKSLKEFVEQGGTLVFLNRASDFAIEQFKLPVRNVVGGLERTDFYVPGSILSIELDAMHPLAKGMPKESIAWVEDSPVFEVVQTENSSVGASAVKIVARYAANQDPLLSGWLLGGDRIKGKAALLEVSMGQGLIILFGFRPQYRAQSLATYPLLFNAITGKWWENAAGTSP